MAIPEHVQTNFQTMMSASDDGNIALIQSRERATGKDVYLVTAMSWDGDAEMYIMTPFAVMIDGNPFDLYDDPIELMDEPERGEVQ